MFILVAISAAATLGILIGYWRGSASRLGCESCGYSLGSICPDCVKSGESPKPIGPSLRRLVA